MFILSKGGYEILGYHTNFKCGIYRCRLCGALDIQNSDINPLMGDDDDIEMYIDAFASDNRQLKQRYGWMEQFALSCLSGVNVWSIAPTDCLHDLAEGVVDKLLCKFILVFCIKHKSSEEVAERIRDFDFYHGKFSIYFSKETKSFKISAKAVQVWFYCHHDCFTDCNFIYSRKLSF